MPAFPAGSDPELRQRAQDDLEDIRHNLHHAVRLLREELYKGFLSGDEVAADLWIWRWTECCPQRWFAELLVWEQNGIRFVIDKEGMSDCMGAAFTLSDAPIRLAHPKEMPSDEVSLWQNYFDKRKISQLFPQMSEPVCRPEDFHPDRYKGRHISCYRLRHKESLGIHLEYEIEHFYGAGNYEHTKFSMDDFSWEALWRKGGGSYERLVDRFIWVQFTSLEPKVWTRRTNAVIALFDRLAKDGRQKDRGP